MDTPGSARSAISLQSVLHIETEQAFKKALASHDIIRHSSEVEDLKHKEAPSTAEETKHQLLLALPVSAQFLFNKSTGVISVLVSFEPGLLCSRSSGIVRDVSSPSCEVGYVSATQHAEAKRNTSADVSKCSLCRFWTWHNSTDAACCAQTLCGCSVTYRCVQRSGLPCSSRSSSSGAPRHMPAQQPASCECHPVTVLMHKLHGRLTRLLDTWAQQISLRRHWPPHW